VAAYVADKLDINEMVDICPDPARHDARASIDNSDLECTPSFLMAVWPWTFLILDELREYMLLILTSASYGSKDHYLNNNTSPVNSKGCPEFRITRM